MEKKVLNTADKEFFIKKLKRGVRPEILSNLYDVPVDILCKLKESI